MPIARNKKSIYDQLRDREKERENCDSIPMLMNKFLTANCEEEKENLKSIFLVFIESVGRCFCVNHSHYFPLQLSLLINKALLIHWSRTA